VLETASSSAALASLETNTAIPGIQALLRTLTFHDPSPDTNLLATGVLDSVTLVQLIAALEKEFAIVIPMDEVGVESFRSVATIAELVAATHPATTSPADQSVSVGPRVELVREIQDLIQETFSVRIKSTEDDLFSTGVIDSIILVQLILRLEERFSLDLVMEDLDLDDFTSVPTIAAFVESCFKKAASAAL
jgi:acyl carrier protein